MKGKLHKTDNGWIVKYKDILNLFPITQTGMKEVSLHPTYEKYYFLDEDAEGGEVEFEIVDYSQKCRECGETVERGRSCTKGCFMKSGNFIQTNKLEYAKLIKNEKR